MQSPLVSEDALSSQSKRELLSFVQFSKCHWAGRSVGGQATISALDLKEPRKARMSGVGFAHPVSTRLRTVSESRLVNRLPICPTALIDARVARDGGW